MELKFDPKCKWSDFRAKYLKSEIEFDDHYLLFVCCVFATFPSFWRPFGAIFCLTVDATSGQSIKQVRDNTSFRQQAAVVLLRHAADPPPHAHGAIFSN